MKTCKRQVLAALVSSALSLGASQVAAEVLASDSFESGDMSAPSHDGFSWERNNRTSIVSSTGVLWSNGSKDIDIPSGRDWTAYDGENSLRFRYPARENMAEQRFSLNESHPELWASFWLRVPANFYHQSGNQKLFALWMDGYSAHGDGSTITLEFRPDGSNEAGSSVFYANVGKGRSNITGGDIGIHPFITVPSDRGRWMNLVIRVVAESSEDESDGILEVWRKWEDESSYTQTQDLDGLPIRIPSDGPNGFKKGYLMGWANGAYSEDTEFLLDDFTLSTESLLKSKPCPPVTDGASAPDGCG